MLVYQRVTFSSSYDHPPICICRNAWLRNKASLETSNHLSFQTPQKYARSTSNKLLFFKLKVHSKHGSSVLKYPSRILGVKASPKFLSPIFKDSRLEPKGHRSPSGHATHVTTPTVAFATLMLPGEAKCCAGWSHQI